MNEHEEQPLGEYPELPPRTFKNSRELIAHLLGQCINCPPSTKCQRCQQDWCGDTGDTIY